ncbi:MAG TPA: hypothetical protein VNA12_06505 [Mycobacteriales bacterium]|nr:hypothetical protein [Mycobacteriales bacterium]
MTRTARLLAVAALCAAPACSVADDKATARPAPSESSSAPPTARQTPEPPCRDAPPQQRGEATLRSLPTAWRASGVTVRFEQGQPGLLGETTMNKPLRVTIYVRPCAEESDALLRHVVAHELGHAWDRYRMTPVLRDGYLAMRRINTSTPWFGCDGCEDFATPAGDFAETYAQWLRGSVESRSELGPAATPEQLEQIAARFFR